MRAKRILLVLWELRKAIYLKHGDGCLGCRRGWIQVFWRRVSTGVKVPKFQVEMSSFGHPLLKNSRKFGYNLAGGITNKIGSLKSADCARNFLEQLAVCGRIFHPQPKFKNKSSETNSYVGPPYETECSQNSILEVLGHSRLDGRVQTAQKHIRN